MAKKLVVTGTRGIPDVSGGVETHVEHLFPLIAEKGFQTYICCRSCYIPEDKRIKAYKNCKLIYISTPKKKSFEAIIHTCKSILKAKSIGADIVHIHAIGPALLVPFAKMLGCKVVFTTHGPDYERQKWGQLAKKILILGEKWGYKYADEVIVISKVIQNQLAEKYGSRKVHLIPNGVEIPVKNESKTYLHEIGVGESPYVLAVARFVEEKGLHDLVDAFKKLEKSDIKLVIAGDADHVTEYSKRLKETCRENKNIYLTGYIKGEKLSQVLSNASLFVLPSYHEGLPISLLEAMSYNLNVLVSNIPPHLEMELGDSCYFKVGNTEDLSKKIMKKMDDRSTPSYISVVEEKYNWSKIAEKTVTLYDELLK